MSNASLQTITRSPPATPGSAVQALPRRQAAWVAAQVLTATGLAAGGLWASDPELALTLSLGVGASTVNLRKLWALPVVVPLVVLGGLLATALDWSPVLGAGAVAGLLIAWLVPESTDWIDYVNGALGTAAGATIGLWAADHLMPDLVNTLWGAAFGGALVGLVASQGLAPLALRFDTPRVPTAREIRRALQPAYRPPVFHAIDLYQVAMKFAPDAVARRGMAEITTWVFRLQTTMQSLDHELSAIDPERIAERIEACESDPVTDTFTRDRRHATAAHLRRLLDHRAAIAVERQRTEALVEYALAFLEEARAGLAVARELPGEAAPDRLPEVLDRLRNHAAAGDARRKTAREMDHMRV